MVSIGTGPRQQHEGLTVFPLTNGTPAELPYVLLADALSAGTLSITEVGSGTVSELLAINKGEEAVLILDGEQLVGARQNRVTNRTLLLAAGSETKIPVSCMEQGRWHHTGSHMKHAPQHAPSKMRSKVRSAEASYAQSGERMPVSALRSAQSAVWADISETQDALDVDSATGALDAVFTTHHATLHHWASEFPALVGQVGLLAFVRGRPLGLDFIGCPTLYSRLHERLLRGYLMDALEQNRTGRSWGRPVSGAAFDPDDAGEHAAEAAAQHFLDAVKGARRVDSPTVGLGNYFVLSGDVIGSELLDERHLVHLSAFPAADGGHDEDDLPLRVNAPPIRRPSQRRGY